MQVNSMTDECIPLRGARLLTPEQLRATYSALLRNPDPLFVQLAATRLKTLDRAQKLDATADASTLRAYESP
jgi:hypothetical protein